MEQVLEACTHPQHPLLLQMMAHSGIPEVCAHAPRGLGQDYLSNSVKIFYILTPIGSLPQVLAENIPTLFVSSCSLKIISIIGPHHPSREGSGPREQRQVLLYPKLELWATHCVPVNFCKCLRFSPQNPGIKSSRRALFLLVYSVTIQVVSSALALAQQYQPSRQGALQDPAQTTIK